MNSSRPFMCSRPTRPYLIRTHSHIRGHKSSVTSAGLLLAALVICSTLAGCHETSESGGTDRSRPIERAANAGPPAVRNLAAAAEHAYLEASPDGIDVTGRGEGQGPAMAGDRFATIEENHFVHVADQPLSTFSIDVDTASYAKARTYLRRGVMPPSDAVRIEEFVNYFPYGYSSPTGPDPLAVFVETAEAPWQPSHRLVRVALKGKQVDFSQTRANLVFLLDVSGSMDYPNKLPLVKQGVRKLIPKLGENDRVAMVVYAGAAGLVLPPTCGDQHLQIETALETLHAGGSTNGGQGIQLAYQVATDNFIPGGVNRVILCSDGDFNVGTTSPGALVRLAQRQAQQGVFLSVLGFGVGNHHDALLEELSNKADGNYYFIDTPREACKVLQHEMNSTLVTIAKDVKVQVEFNPARVASHRLIGYENRRLHAEDFADDQQDAGEVGAGHAVTALYEIILAGDVAAPPLVEPLRYQTSPQLSAAAASTELLTVKVRYKLPRQMQSNLLVQRVLDDRTSFANTTSDFQFAAAVAAFGMLLRDSKHQGAASYASVYRIAKAARGEDQNGYRQEFLELVDTARRLARG